MDHDGISFRQYEVLHILTMFWLLERLSKDKFKDFRSRPPNGGFGPKGKSQFSDEFFEYRRSEREKIGLQGTASAWSSSPTHIDW